MTDPYREATFPTCPYCREALDGGPDSFSCHHDHGDWIARASLASVPLDRAARLGTRSVPCPTCKQPMEWRKWKRADFDTCAEHGTWVGIGHRTHFYDLVAGLVDADLPAPRTAFHTRVDDMVRARRREEQLALDAAERARQLEYANRQLAHELERDARTIVALLATETGRHAFAHRFLALEREVAELRARLDVALAEAPR